VVTQAPVKGRQAVKVNFVLPKDAVAGNVSVVGDFNGWDPLAHPLRPRRDGTRSTVVTLPRGRRFAFRYLAEGGRWHDDPTAEAFEPNGVGGHNAVRPHLAARLGPGHRRLRLRPRPVRG
jgi:1,4-alpha-glucan branching enzyme